jgi:hypothetical protein
MCGSLCLRLIVPGVVPGFDVQANGQLALGERLARRRPGRRLAA